LLKGSDLHFLKSTSIHYLGTNSANTDTIDHFAGMAMVPMLVHKLFLGLGKCAQFAVEAFIVRIFSSTIIFVIDFIHPVSIGIILALITSLTNAP
jgi:hypothetical protein